MFGYINKKTKRNLKLEDPVYSGRNAKWIWDYLVIHGTHLDFFFDGIALPKEQLLDENEWFDIHTAMKLWHNYRKCLPDFDITQITQISFEAFQRSWHGMFKLLTQFSSIKNIIKIMPRLASTIYKVDLIKVLELKKNSAIIEYKPYPGFETFIDSSHVFSIAGYLAAIPVIHNQPRAEVKEVASLIDIFKKFQIDFGQFNHKIEEKQGIVFLNNERAGKWITISKNQALHPAVLKYLPLEKCILWEKEITGRGKNGRQIIIARKGDLYNCRKSIFTIQWENDSVFSRARQILPFSKRYMSAFFKNRESLFKQTSMLHDQAKTLNDRISEKTEELSHAYRQILEFEKRTLEHRITQGFAHEMENTLTQARYGMESAPSLNGINDNSFLILKNLQKIQEEFDSPKNQITDRFIPRIKKIMGISGQLQESFTGISDDIERGLKICAQINRYAETHLIKPGNNRVDLDTLLNALQQKYQAIFKGRQIQIDVSQGNANDVYILADEEHIHSILENLINNARDALLEGKKENAKILMTIKSEPSCFILSVQDNGPGIPKDQIQKIFNPFFSTKPSKGTGLGLSTAKRYVELYKGHIIVESRVGEGTVFHIHFPRIRKDGVDKFTPVSGS